MDPTQNVTQDKAATQAQAPKAAEAKPAGGARRPAGLRTAGSYAEGEAMLAPPPGEDGGAGAGPWAQLAALLGKGDAAAGDALPLIERLNEPNKAKLAGMREWITRWEADWAPPQVERLHAALRTQLDRTHYDGKGEEFYADTAFELKNAYVGQGSDGLDWSARTAKWSAWLCEAAQKAGDAHGPHDLGKKKTYFSNQNLFRYSVEAFLPNNQPYMMHFTADLVAAGFTLEKAEDGYGSDELSYRISGGKVKVSGNTRTGQTVEVELALIDREIKVIKNPVLGARLPKQEFGWKQIRSVSGGPT